MGTCRDCHSSYPLNSGDGAFTIVGPAQFLAGDTYEMTVELTDPDQSRWGFELTPLTFGTITITDPTNTQVDIENGKSYVKQTSAGTYNGTPNGPVTWSFDWTAPSDPPDTITFYAAGTAADGTGSPARDYVYTATFTSTQQQVLLSCENPSPWFCRGTHFNFRLMVTNNSGGNVSGTLTFSGYSGYDCDPGNVLVTIARAKTYPPGTTEQYYQFQVPNAVGPGQYSTSIAGTLSGVDVFCCMNADIVQCSPWRRSDNAEWSIVEVERPEVSLPTVTELHQNYPNPFNANTNISYTLAEAGNVNLSVYDISGRLVTTLADGYQESGEHVASWDASQLSSGVYFCKLTAVDYTLTKKMNLLR